MKLLERLKRLPIKYQIDDPRTEWVNIRVTPAEKAALIQTADSVGLNLSNMLYRLLKEVVIEHEKNIAKNDRPTQ